MRDRQTAFTPIPRAALILGLLGLVPFAFCAVAVWMPMSRVSPWQALTAGLIYGGLILAFLGGVRGGAALGPIGSRRQAIDFAAGVLSVPVALFGILAPPVIGLSLLVAAYLLQALWDVMAVEQGLLPQWFGRLRMIVATGAVLAFLTMLVKLFT